MHKSALFDILPKEIMWLIFHEVVVSGEPIQITYCTMDIATVLAPLLVCKRFHKIAKLILYRYNKFEFRFFCSDFYLNLFLSSLSNHVYNYITCLRIYWGTHISNFDSCISLIAYCKKADITRDFAFPCQYKYSPATENTRTPYQRNKISIGNEYISQELI